MPDERVSAADLVGLLAEDERRRVFAALVLGARTVPEVAAATELPVRVVSAALQRLGAGGLLTTDRDTGRHEPAGQAFKAAMRTEQRVSAGRGDGAGSYFRRGRLVSVPVEATTRARVLAVVADTFEPGRSYTEARVNALCAEWHDDWVTLRRALVDEGLLARDRSGARYRRAPEPGGTAVRGDDTPRKRMAAHAVVRDDDGRVLLVQPTYAPGWLLPGGAVERDESPREACARELREELGRDHVVGRLLVLEWVGPRPDLTEGLMVVYDGGVVPAGTELRLPPDELAASRWVAPEDVTALTGAELGRRVAAALEAVRAGTVVELEDGARRP